MQRTGWEMFSWVLMSNHYHLVFKTPEANLVAGMKWLQNTWTKRFNARHRLWGHVFGGRYKAVPVEENEHLACLIDYVHLNPVRAGLIDETMEVAGVCRALCSAVGFSVPRSSVRRCWRNCVK